MNLKKIFSKCDANHSEVVHVVFYTVGWLYNKIILINMNNCWMGCGEMWFRHLRSPLGELAKVSMLTS